MNTHKNLSITSKLIYNLTFVIILLAITNIGNLVVLYAGFRPNVFTVFATTIGAVLILIKIFNNGFRLSKSDALFTLLLLIIPVFIELINFNISIRYYGLYFYYLIIFILSTLALKQYGVKRFEKLLSLSLFLVVAFTLVSFFIPELTDMILLQYHGVVRLTADYRAYGVYLQPNMTATLILLLIFSLHYIKSLNNSMLLLGFIGIGFTLSRSALIVIGLFVIFNLDSKRYIRYALIMILISFLTVLYVSYDDRVYERVQTIINITDSIEEDGSLNHRFNAFESYLNLIAKSPITGIGAIQESIYIGSNLLPLSSHNAHLTIILRYGFVYYMIYLVVVLIKPMIDSKNFLILTLLLLHFFGTHSYLSIPMYYLFLGMLATIPKIQSKDLAIV